MVPSPDDLMLMRLNVLVNIVMKLGQALLSGGAGLLISGVAVWLYASAVDRFIRAITRLWEWSREWSAPVVIGVCVVAAAFTAYAAGVLALSMRPIP